MNNNAETQQLAIQLVSGSLQDIQEIIEFLQWAFRKLNKMEETKKQEKTTQLNIADIMQSLYQKIAKEHKVHTDRIMLAITDNGKYFQVYVTNEVETELRFT